MDELGNEEDYVPSTDGTLGSDSDYMDELAGNVTLGAVWLAAQDVAELPEGSLGAVWLAAQDVAEVPEDVTGGSIFGAIESSISQNEKEKGDSGAHKDIDRMRTESDIRMTAADLQLGRIGHVEGRVQNIIHEALTGNLNVGPSPTDRLEVMAMVDKFTNITGVAPETFASRMNVEAPSPVTSYGSISDANAGINGTIHSPTYAKQDVSQALSMLGKTSGDYMDSGPGEKLENHNINVEKQAEAEDRLLSGLSAIDELAELYIHGDTRGTMAYKGKKLALVESFTKRFSRISYEGSKAILPLPNETNVTGIVPTMSYWGKMGTDQDRLSFGGIMNELPDFLKNMTGKPTEGRMQISGDNMFKAMPSLANSLFPLPPDHKIMNDEQKQKNKRDQKFKLDQAYILAERGRKTVREFTPNLAATTPANSALLGEAFRGGSRTGGGLSLPNSAYGVWAEQDNARNEAALLDMEWDAFSGGRVNPGSYEEKNTAYTRLSAALSGSSPEFTLPPNGVPTEYEMQKASDNFSAAQARHEKSIRVSGALADSARENFQDAEGVGSVGRGGMYGTTPLSEQERFIEGYNEGTLEREEIAYPDTDLGRYQEWVAGENPAKQGTDAWLKQRVGHITASQADRLVTPTGQYADMGSERYAVELATERLLPGHNVFLGNAHMREGNDGEQKAQNAFMSLMAKNGRNLTIEEAYFETNEGGMPGFGVSPDARLYEEDGSSAGLVELKYLSSKSMAGALKKYTPQMQMQMAVSREKVTNFFALNKHTGEYVHEEVFADPDFQEKLKVAGAKTLELEHGLTPEGVYELRKKIESKRHRSKDGGGASAGQEALYRASASPEAEKPMSVYNEKRDGPLTEDNDDAHSLQTRLFELNATQTRTPDPLSMITYLEAITTEPNASKPSKKEALVLAKAENTYRDKVAADDKRHEAAARKRGLQEVSAIREDGQRSTKSEKADRAMGLKESAALREDGQRSTKSEKAERAMALQEIKAYAEGDKRDDEALKESLKEEAEARKKATDSLDSFTNSVKTAKKVLGSLSEIASFASGGTQSVLETEKFAKRHGLDAGQVRGMVYTMKDGGLTLGEAKSAVSAAGNRVLDLENADYAKGEILRMAKARSFATDMPGIQSMGLPDYGELRDLDPAQLLAMQLDYEKDLTVSEQAYSARNIFQNINLVGMRGVTGDDLLNSYSDEVMGKVPKAYETNRGVESVLQLKQDTAETMGSTNYTGGQIQQGVQEANSLLNSSTANLVGGGVTALVGKKLLSKFGKGGKGPLKSLATPKVAPSLMATKNVVKLGVAARVAKAAVGGVAGLVPLATRWALGVEDDGGLGDSALDIAEMAGYGAMVGSIFPGPGTLIGAGIGAGVGAVNEAYEYFTAEDPVPSEDIGNLQVPGKAGQNVQVNNVDVDVRIDPTGYKVETNVNGDETLDEGLGVGT